jgi:hypothetical protein
MQPHEYGLLKAAYSVNETLALLSLGRTSLYQLVKDAAPLRRFSSSTNSLIVSPDGGGISN